MPDRRRRTVAGMAYEALNNAGALGRRLIVVLNDNNMSISPPVGALCDHLLDIRATGRPGEQSERTISVSSGSPMCGVDGHDVEALVHTLRTVKHGCRRPRSGPRG